MNQITYFRHNYQTLKYLSRSWRNIEGLSLRVLAVSPSLKNFTMMKITNTTIIQIWKKLLPKPYCWINPRKEPSLPLKVQPPFMLNINSSSQVSKRPTSTRLKPFWATWFLIRSIKTRTSSLDHLSKSIKGISLCRKCLPRRLSLRCRSKCP